MAVLEKARRLQAAHQVSEVESRTYLVDGDHGTHVVTVIHGRVVCSCRHDGVCSHVLAAAIDCRAAE